VYKCSKSDNDLQKSLETWRAAAGWKLEGCVCDMGNRRDQVGLFHKVDAHFQGKLDILVSRWNISFCNNHPVSVLFFSMNFVM
jgi:hypothetical protein